MGRVQDCFTVALLLSLGACDNVPSLAHADDCLDLPVYPPAGVIDLPQTVIACVERNAALYAKGRDAPEALADAVVIKCQPEIMSNVADAARKAGEKPQIEEAIDAWRKHALPVIAEARARGCYS